MSFILDISQPSVWSLTQLWIIEYTFIHGSIFEYFIVPSNTRFEYFIVSNSFDYLWKKKLEDEICGVGWSGLICGR